MSQPKVHDRAIVATDAALGDGVEVGPGAVIESGVHIGPQSKIGPYAVIRAGTHIGANNTLDAHVVIGGEPQHTAFDGSDTRVRIGDNNVFREYVTVNRGFEADGETRIGSNCFFMTAAHVGHDCKVEDNVVLTNNATLAGHVEVGCNVVMGGMAATHQFTRIGRFCMVAGFTPLRKDSLPFMMIGGTPIRHYRLNAIGLKRSGIVGERYRALELAFRALRASDKSLTNVPETEEVAYLRDWLKVKTKYGHYGFLTGKRRD